MPLNGDGDELANVRVVEAAASHLPTPLPRAFSPPLLRATMIT
jgi:hypothetical protein